MPGKYSHLKDSLTKFVPEMEYQEKVNRKKDEIKNNLRNADYPVNYKTLGSVYAEARREKDRLEELIKEQNLIIEALSQDLVDMLEDQDLSKVTLGSGASISIKDDIYCTVKDRQTFLKWIKETDQEDLLTVNYQTMASMVKTRLIEGEEPPPGISTYFKQSITLYGAKNA